MVLFFLLGLGFIELEIDPHTVLVRGLIVVDFGIQEHNELIVGELMVEEVRIAVSLPILPIASA